MSTYYLHFIGKPRPFMAAALKFGVSRRIQAAHAKAMNFGDRVICLQWRGKSISPAAFAEFRISAVYFNSNIHVGEKLLEQGKAEYRDYSAGGSGAMQVDRECGAFMIGGAYSLKDDVTLAEIVAMAEQEIKEAGGRIADLWCMIGGTITKTYDVPMTITPSVAFFRGFKQIADGEYRIGDAPAVTEPITNEIRVVENYERRMSDLQ